MKLNLNMQFPDLDGNPMKDGDKVIDLRHILKLVSTAELKEDTEGSAQTSIDLKMKNFDMYLKVRESKDEIDFTPEEIVYLKPRMARLFSVLIVGPLFRVFDGKQPYSTTT